MIPVPGYQSDKPFIETYKSRIFKAVRESDKTPVIIKVLKGSYPESLDMLVFRQLLSKLDEVKNDSILGVNDIIETSSSLALVYDNYNGNSLKDLIRKGSIDLSLFFHIAAQLCEIIAHFQKHDIIHYGIKPSNILIHPDSRQVKVMDAGMYLLHLKSDDDFFNPDVIRSCLTYFSPEQTGRVNRPMDYRTDMYSLGVTFYEMLTGLLPFLSEDPLDVIHGHLARPPLSPPGLSERIPDILMTITRKLLAKNAEGRYQNALGLLADLNRCRKSFDSKKKVAPFPLGQKDVAIRFTQPQILVGRDKDIQVMWDFISKDEAKSRMLIVTGPPGIGKTALIYEINKPVLERRGYFISGKYEQFKRDLPYSAIIQALSDLMKQISSESRKKFDHWRQLINKTLGPNGSIITNLIPAAEMVIGPQPPLAPLDPEAGKNRFNLVILDFIRVLAQKEHPLVLFLDDLQWADLPSIQLVKTMMCDPMIRSFYVICSFRDNEVEPTSALSMMFNDLAQAGCDLGRLTLSPIKPKDIERIIVNLFKIPPGDGEELSLLLHQKTLGNPFFVNQCLKTLYEQGLISHDPLTGFYWSMQEVDGLPITENVVDLLSHKILGLPNATQHILKTGACIGNRFDLPMLAQVAGISPGSIIDTLSSAMDQGFIGLENHKYVFIHDRIQEAAYALIPGDEKPKLHYRIGSLELAHTPHDELPSKLFYITEHMNRGMAQIENDDEKLRLVNMNLSCAQKAKQSSAYSSGIVYIDKALQLTPLEYWQNHHKLMIDLHMVRLELNFFMGNYSRVYVQTDELLHRIESIPDKISILKIKALSYNAEIKWQGTLSVLDDIHGLLGTSRKKKITPVHILFQYIKLRAKQSLCKVETWDSFPEMTDPEELAFLDFEVVTSTALYFTDKNAMIHNTFILFKRFFKKGTSPEFPFYMTGMGFILIAGFNQIDLGYRFGKSGIRLLKKKASQKYLPSSYHLFNVLIRHWKDHFKLSIDDFKDNYFRAVESGELFFASLSLLYHLAAQFRTGVNLLEVNKNMGYYSQPMAKLMQIPGIMIYHMLWSCVMDLIGIDPEHIDEYQYLVRQADSNDDEDLRDSYDLMPLFSYYRAILHITHHQYEKANTHIDEVLRSKDAIIGTFFIRDIVFFQAISQLALLPKTSGRQRSKQIRLIRKNLKQLKRWAKHCPENTAHMESLVRAEYEAFQNHTSKAQMLYENAINQARSNGYIQDQAIALEKAAHFYEALGKKDKAEGYIRDAYICYRKWGAKTKQKALESQYPDVFSDHTSTLSVSSESGHQPLIPIGESMSEHRRDLDVWSILKVTRTLSEEIVLEHLLSKLMAIVIESAGAQRGCIIFEHEGSLFIEAEKIMGQDTIRLETRPIKNHDTVSTTIINLTARSQSPMLVDNAEDDMSLSHDPYIQSFRPKSVLCVPMLNKGRLLALLYLENNESNAAFTPANVDVIQILAQQAVVSIENAKLYKDVSQSEEKYRTILESIDDAYFELDLDGTISFCNPSMETMFGYTPGEILSLSIHDLMPPDVARHSKLIYETVKQTGLAQKGLENLIYKKDGSTLFVEGSISLMVNEDREPSGFRGLLRDITQKKESEKLKIEKDVAEKANQSKSMFLANMSHEIRTPMNAILGFSTLLNEHVTDEQSKGYLDTIQSSGRMLMMLINDILDLSKIEAGKMALKNTVICPSAILDDLIRTFSPKALEKKNTLTLHMDKTLPQYVIMDEIRLRQIMMNLMGNATKFTDKGCITLGISGSVHGDTVDLDIYVKDEGIGIAPDQLDHIFETFEQSQDHNTAKYGGTGLGLSLSKKLAEAMGGTLTVESQPDHGSTFTVSFPGVPIADTCPLNGSKIDLDLSIRFEPATLLVADDNRENRQMIQSYLIHQPITLFEAQNGREAVEKAETTQPDLILMDLYMPQMDGYEATRTIKKKFPSLPILAITASVLKNEDALSCESGCAMLLRKPLEKETLIQSMSGFLAHHIIQSKSDTLLDIPEVFDEKNPSSKKQSPEIQNKIPELISLLTKEKNGEWEDIKDIFITEQIQSFADRMISLGHQYKQDELIHWATAVKTHSTHIDIEKTFETLEQFPKIIHQISKKAG